jgi:uncharacterized protein YecE (DUF72 family)
MAAVGQIRIGTSGWTYAHWVGAFYPAGTRAEARLGVYARRFDAVEINNTFYSLPEPKTVAGWRLDVPEGFTFAVKASRYLTHLKKLKDPAEPLARLLACIAPLEAKLGPLLFQLPPHWRVDHGRLRALLELLPAGGRHAFEFRDASWHDDEVLDLLAAHGAAFVVFDIGGERSPVRVTADFVYLRLHGPGAAYEGSYDGRTLFGWARRCLGWRDEGRDVYVFFDNDQKAYAPWDAHRLKTMIDERVG